MYVIREGWPRPVVVARVRVPAPAPRANRKQGALALVTATEDPYTLRVSFFLQESPLTRSEIVCNAYATDDGIDVEYLYHDQQMRTIAGSTWNAPQESQMRLTPILIAQIEAGVMAELWNAFRRKVRVMEMA